MNFKSFVDSPVKMTMLFIALVLLGWLSYQRLPLNLFPDLQTPRISLVVTTNGLTPEEAERRLTAQIEQRLSSIKGVANLTSYSREKNIVVHVDFHWGRDMEFAYLDVKKNMGVMETDERIDKIEVFRFDPNAAPLMTLAFTGSVDRIQATNLIENSLKPKLETIEGVAYVNAKGISHQEVIIHVNEDAMAQYKLTPERIIEEIRNSNFSTTGGVVVEGSDELVLKFISRFRNVEDIGRCVVTMADNVAVHLDQIGELTLGESEDEMLVHQDGQISVSLDLFKEPDANAVQTARRVREIVEIMNTRGDFGLKVAVDLSLEVEASIGEVVETALIGMGLATIVLFIFLRNIIATIIVAAAIPISIIATFSLMYFQGLSLNIMTLGGLALGAGMLVDNGIVVMENVFRHRQAGLDSREAAIRGVREVAMAITAATLTTIVVFLPLVYVHGIAGILFKDQALTVVYSLLMSLLVALLLIPMLSARLGKARATEPGFINHAYGRFLSHTLRLRWLLLIGFVAIMWGTWVKFQTIPAEFFPEGVNGRITMLLELPPGTPLEQTEETVTQIERRLLRLRYKDADLAPLLGAFERWQISRDDRRFLREAKLAFIEMRDDYDDKESLARMAAVVLTDDEEGNLEAHMESVSDLLDGLLVLRSVTSTIGIDPDSVQSADDKIFGAHSARIEIVMNPNILRELPPADIISFLRDMVERIPGATSSFESKNEFLQELLGRNRGDVVIEVHGEDLPSLRQGALDATGVFNGVPGLINIRTNLILGNEEYNFLPDRDALNRRGFKVREVSRQIEAYLSGEISEKLKLDQGEMAISVRNPRADREGLTGLLNLQIVSQNGEREKLQNLIHIYKEPALLEVMRVNQEKTLLVMADLDKITYQEAIEALEPELDQMPWAFGSSWNISGEEVKRRESFARLFFALVIATALVYMVIASILESIIHPITIMLSVPFALAGVVASFLIMGISLNIMGYIGVVMLVGIVVNDAIVLLDRIHQLREENRTVYEAVVLAARQRLRPIVMTSLTTILALFPLALGFGNGAELRRPMAIAVIGGLVSSTLLTLWILPSLYLCVEDLIRAARRLVGRSPEVAATTPPGGSAD